MKTEDFDRLKAVCEKEGFELLNESASDNAKFFVVKKAKDIWEGVEFASNSKGYVFLIKSKTETHVICNNGPILFKHEMNPSTESAYIEQLKAEAFKMFGEIEPFEKFYTEFDDTIFEISDSYEGFDYTKRNDQLRFNGWSIYQGGKWATRVKERVKVEFVEATSSSNKFEVVFKIPNAMDHMRNYKGGDCCRLLASKLEEYLNKE